MGRRRQPQQRARRASEQRPANWWALPAFLAAVFAFKLLILTQLQDHPLLQPEGALDAAAYVSLAHRVTAGDLLLGPGLYYVSPLYIYFLAALFSIADSLVFARTVQLALGTAAVGCVFVAARTWFGPRAAWFSATLTALTGLFTFYEIVLFQSSLDVFLTSAGLACVSGVFRLQPEATKPHPVASTFRWKIALAGVFFGLQILNRPNIAIAVAGLAIALLVMRHRQAAAWFVAAAALTLTPVVARNLVVSRQFALASSQGGLNFFIGNNPEATGQYVAIPGIRANIEGQAEDTRRVAEAAEGRQLSDGEVSGHFTGLAMSWIRQQPGAATKLFLKKLALVFNARHQWLDYSYPYYAHDTGSWLWLLFVGPWLLVPLGVGGFAFGSRGSQGSAGSGGSWVLATFVVTYAVSVAVFFVAERYRLPLLAALCVSSGATAAEVTQALRRRASRLQPRGSAAVAGVLAVGGVILAAWPFHLPDGRFEERLRLSKAYMNRHDYAAAVNELQSAHELKPNDTATEFNLGMALVSSGRPEEGIAHVRHAVDAGTPVKGARYALAGALLTTGDREGAVTLLRGYYPADDDSAESCYQVARLALGAGAPRVAERYLQRALQLRPGWPEALAALEQVSR
jgi:hypothetical protein